MSVISRMPKLAVALAMATGMIVVSSPGGASPFVAVGRGARAGAPVHADRIYRWSASDPVAADSQYAETVLGLDQAHLSAQGAGTIVAVVDSGIQLRPAPHPALAASTSAVGADFVDGDSVPDDVADGVDNDRNGLVDEGAGHGTHVAGIIHRVAPLATIMPVRVLDSDGNGSEWNVVRGMLWAADHGADVVNLSLGADGAAGLLQSATQTLVDRGVVVVAAAGNDGGSHGDFPAASRCAIAVTGTSSTDAVSSFATTGGWVDVGAPAENIASTFPFFPTGYATQSGTSMAAAFVAGEAALLRGVDPSLSVGDVMAYVQGTTVPYSQSPGNSGRGRIAPLAALKALGDHARPDPRSVGVDQRCLSR